jgi:hypothetical protein
VPRAKKTAFGARVTVTTRPPHSLHFLRYSPILSKQSARPREVRACSREQMALAKGVGAASTPRARVHRAPRAPYIYIHVPVWRYGPAVALVSLWGAHAPLNRSYQVVPSPPWPVLASPRSPVPSVLSDRARTACTGYEHSLVGAQEQRAHDDSSKAIMVQGAGPSLRIGRLPAVLPVGNPPAVAGVRGRQEAPRNLPRSLPAAIARCHGPACARPCARRTRGPTDLISLI